VSWVRALLPAAWGILLALQGGPSLEVLRPEETLMAIFNLDNQIRIEQSLLAELLAQYEASAEERDRYVQRLERLYGELEAAWDAPPESFDAEAVRRLDDELERLEKAQEIAWSTGRRLRREVMQSRQRVDLLREQVDRLLQALPSDTESLTGYWDVTLLSGGERGVFVLVQSGAVLSGEYGLQGGFRGSLQGTLIDGQVVLHRIDTRLGRVMDLDGLVSTDGNAIRGTWRRYDLSDGRPATGAWVANRRPRGGGPNPEPP
jgi:hypothetical protein